jgi:hypothetical protein
MLLRSLSAAALMIAAKPNIAPLLFVLLRRLLLAISYTLTDLK